MAMVLDVSVDHLESPKVDGFAWECQKPLGPPVPQAFIGNTYFKNTSILLFEVSEQLGVIRKDTGLPSLTGSVLHYKAS